ncbi:MAG: activator of osmoprotectant transporter prop [Proteobacteria bacterium]|nr:activator of osmoprotectant transporter prop [Pseudomonadota bacterium]
MIKGWLENHAVFRDCLPLAIGIDKQLLALYPQTERKILRMALRYHTSSMRYLKAMEKATVRHNLDGSAADEVPDSHREHAAEQMRERLRKEAERRKSQRQAEAAAAEERQRAEKLEQLAAKFSRR